MAHDGRQRRGDGVIVLRTDDEVTVRIFNDVPQRPRRFRQGRLGREERRTAHLRARVRERAAGTEDVYRIDDLDLVLDDGVGPERGGTAGQRGFDPLDDAVAKAGVPPHGGATLRADPRKITVFRAMVLMFAPSLSAALFATGGIKLLLASN